MIHHVQPGTFMHWGRIWALLLVGCFFSPVESEGQSVHKIGVVNLAQAVETSTEGRKAAEQWTARMNERGTEVQSKREELAAAQQEAQNPDPGTSEAVRLQLNRAVERLTTDLNRLTEDIDLELNAFRQELIFPISQKVNEAIQAYATEQGFTLIIDSSVPQGGLLFVQDVADITTEIIRRVDASMAETPPPGPEPETYR